jgi:hypothetical protein
MTRAIKIIPVMAMCAILFSSCSKDANFTNKNSLALEVAGTYSGILKNSTTNQSTQATVTTSVINDSLIFIHCFGSGFDTTIKVQLYQNFDSIMFCFTGHDFYDIYGHYENNYDFCFSKQSGWVNNGWMNNGSCWGNKNINWGNSNWAGNDQWNAWTNHMNTQHNQHDTHYGWFNSTSKSFNYHFKMHSGSSYYFEIFDGVLK